MRIRAVLVIGLVMLSVLTLAAFFVIDAAQRIPSASECADLWNRGSNVESQRAVIGFDEARAEGWDTKAGPHCSVHFFTRPGAPWEMYVLWLAAAGGIPDSFHEDIGGERYGRGELGGEKPRPANATVHTDGRIGLRCAHAGVQDFQCEPDRARAS